MPKKTHSQIGASSAYRWFECPGSVALCEKVPPQEPSEYAKVGTAAHAVIQERFADPEKDIVIPDFLGEEDIASINTFLDVIEADRAKGKYIFYSEIKFALDRVLPGLFGTCDVVLLSSDLKKLIVYEYKHGAGVPVEVEYDKQLLYYALGAIQEADRLHKVDLLDVLGWGAVFKEVEVVIVQPRCRHKDGVIRRWSPTALELEVFANELKVKALEAMSKNAALIPGDHCRFCPAQAVCPAIAEKTLALAKADFADIKEGKTLILPKPQTLTKSDLSKILQFSSVIEGWLKSVEGYALELLQHNEDVPGFKLVKKRANRAWKSEQEAVDTLSLYLSEAQLWERKLLSPAKVDKLLKKDKKVVADLTIIPDNGNTIALVHDPREAVKGTAETDFNKIDE